MKILVPLDGSEFSRQALNTVCRLFDPRRDELTLLRVASPPQSPTPFRPQRPLVLDAWIAPHDLTPEEDEHAIYSSQLWEDFRAELQDRMAADLGCLRDAGFRVELAVQFGDPAEEIADFARRQQVDLVVMATHGRSGLSRALLGSVAEKVLRRAEVPVLMVRPTITRERRETAANGSTEAAPPDASSRPKEPA